MRVAELPGVGQPLRMATRPIPEPGPGEVRVRVEACGVCGSDLFLQAGGFRLQRGGERRERFPVVPGHEAAGVVDRLGPGVTGPPVGAQVAIYYVDPAPDSPYVAAGRENRDPHVTRMGVDVDGGFAEYVVRRADTLIETPAPLDPAALAVLTDAVATPYHALTARANLQAGETLVVLGVGGLGSNAVQLGRYLGARVVAVSRQQAKLDLARRLGADEVVEATDDVVEQVRRLTGGGGDVVIQCAGSAALDQQAIAMAGIGGRVAFVGVSQQPFEALAGDLIWRELSLLGSCRFTRDDIRAVVELHLAGVLSVDHLVQRVRPLEEANDALEDIRHGRVLRSVLAP
jgi:D-arabinose 1-dehydrogenase-like Zn-dependent alcohol dehydrogenase